MAVNLTDTATYEDRVSPEGRAAFTTFYSIYMAGRQVADFKALHVLAANGKLLSVDFGISVDLVLPVGRYAKREYQCHGAMRSESAERLIALCNQYLASLPPDAIIPALPPEPWWDFWVAPLIGMRVMDMERARNGRVFFALRGAV